MAQPDNLPRTHLVIEDLEILFDGSSLFLPLSFSIAPSEIVSIIGPSGVGKTSTLRAIAGLIPNVVTFRSLHRSNKTAIVFQDSRLLPWCDVISNTVFPIEIERDLHDSDIRIARTLLRHLGLENSEHKMPSEISGGMRQRVAISRALITLPDLLLMDEPFAGLDFDTKLKTQRVILEQVRHTRSSILFVTHDIDDAVSLSSRIICLQGRQLPSRTIVLDWKHGLIDPVDSRQNIHHFELVRDLLVDVTK